MCASAREPFLTSLVWPVRDSNHNLELPKGHTKYCGCSELSGPEDRSLNLNSLLVKRQNDNPSPGAETGEN